MEAKDEHRNRYFRTYHCAVTNYVGFNIATSTEKKEAVI